MHEQVYQQKKNKLQENRYALYDCADLSPALSVGQTPGKMCYLIDFSISF